jgi:hypothetical protein
MRATSALGTDPSVAVSSTEPLAIQVIFDRDPSGYSAEVRVSGRKQGVRKVDAAGDDCAALAEATTVVLAMVLDRLPGDALSAPSSAPPEQPTPAPLTASAPSRESAPSDGAKATRVVFAVEATGGVAYGMIGANASGMVGAAAHAGARFWEVQLGAAWTPARGIPYAGEEVRVGAVSGRIDGCLWFTPGGKQFRAAGCTSLWLTALHGEGHGFDQDHATTQFWPALAGGLTGRWRLSPRWALRLAGWGLVPLRRVTFSVAGLGTAFETHSWAVVTELGPELIFE